MMIAYGFSFSFVSCAREFESSTFFLPAGRSWLFFLLLRSQIVSFFLVGFFVLREMMDFRVPIGIINYGSASLYRVLCKNARAL